LICAKLEKEDDMEYGEITVYLKNGNIFVGKYDQEEYDDIYDSWNDQRKFLTFSNGQFLVSEIAGIEWEL
jgi:hypothetical protein